MTILQNMTCKVEGCARLDTEARGLCHMHYQRSRKGSSLHKLPLELHGMSHTRTYSTWKAMQHRCYASSASDYRYYGGRGITVCDRWRKSFNAFFADMGERPEGMTLDRIDSDGPYEPSNCKWSDPTEQITRINRDRGAVPYRGVHYGDTNRSNYVAAIGKDYKNLHIGFYDTPEEAAWMYDQWALCLHGDYAQLNFEYV